MLYNGKILLVRTQLLLQLSIRIIFVRYIRDALDGVGIGSPGMQLGRVAGHCVIYVTGNQIRCIKVSH